MSWLSEWLHPGRKYDAAQDEYNKYYQEAQNPLNEYLKNLMNPGALRDQWEKGYKESDAAKNAESTATQRGLDAASSMGLGGSSAALSAIQGGTAGIAAEDKQNYLKDLMDKYTQGIGVAGNISNNAMNMGDRSASMAFGRKGAQGDLFGGLLGGGLNGLIQLLTGGFGGHGQGGGGGFGQGGFGGQGWGR